VSHCPRSLYFLSDHLPLPRIGSPVVLWRHLSRFEAEGWRIRAIVPRHKFAGATFPTNWDVQPLPARRWWWPPVLGRSARLQAWRTALLARQLRSWISPDEKGALLTVLWNQTTPDLARALAKRTGLPLHVIVHDDQALWESADAHSHVRAAQAHILAAAHSVWPVSQELGDALPGVGFDRSHPLIPIPGSSPLPQTVWREEFRKPVVIHAGSLHAFQAHNFARIADTLAPLGGRLVVISPERSRAHVAELLANRNNVEWRPEFATPEEMLHFAAQHASAALVSYAFESSAQPWAKTSFASRWAELTRTGLPVIILAPSETATGRFAAELGWKAHLSSMDANAMHDLMNTLATQSGWALLAGDSRQATATVFSADHIHAAFAKAVEESARTPR
jgi:hypothetical protein